MSDKAFEIMKQQNPNALVAHEDGKLCMVEDITDADDRMYRIEIQSTLDGTHAVAFCRHNPWSDNPFDYHVSHMAQDGFLCITSASERDITKSSINLKDAILRARYWCTAYSVLRETGQFPMP